MIQVDVPLAAAMASAAAAAARTQLRTGTRADYLHAWLATNLFLMFGFAWIPIYFLIAYFGWETTHMWWTSPEVTDYPWMIPASMVLLFAFGNGGFVLGAQWIREGRDRLNRAFYLGILVACIAWMVWFYPRTLKLGSAETWPTAAWCYEEPAFVAAWAITSAVWFGSYGLLIGGLRRRGQQTSQADGHTAGSRRP
jgi:hypothetical protein